MIPALRWAAMRAILMFQKEVMEKVTRQCTLRASLSGTFLQMKDVVNQCLEFEDSVHKPQPF